LTDVLMRAWHELRIRVFAAAYQWIMDVFHQFLEGVERILYVVDEWLRYRRGDSKFFLIIKGLVGSIWSVVRYMIRIYVTLLIEPQVNPIKHFPVVTVSHKLILPASVYFGTQIVASLQPFMGAFLANALVWTNIVLLPGVFGFLVWELKENWRLFAANRSPALRPALMGHHGETMARLLRPGFHSGTIPKRYRRLRRAERRAQFTDNWKAARKHREALGDAAESIRRFTQRQFVALLDESRTWGPVHVTVGEIFVGSNSARIELACPQIGREPAWMAFQEQSSWLVGGVLEPGWIDELDHPRREALRDALAGFYKLAGVELVRQQIAAGFAPRGVHYDVAERGLVVWPDRSYRSEAFYDLRIDAPTIPPQSAADQDAGDLPTFYPAELIFKLHGISWQAWVETWERDARGEGHPRPILDGIPLLSAPAASRGILTRVAGE